MQAGQLLAAVTFWLWIKILQTIERPPQSIKASHASPAEGPD